MLFRSGPNSLRSQTFTFVSEVAGTEDYHLQSTDTGALNNGSGATPKGLFTDDIDGQTRPTIDLDWDIGADEYGHKTVINSPTTGYYTSGLVGEWSFNGKDTNWTSATAGTTNDLSGNNNTGTMTNMSRSSSPKPGISGQALSFDGVDDYVNVGTPTGWSNTAGTLSVWVKPDFADDVGTNEGIFTMYTGDTNYLKLYYRGYTSTWDFYQNHSGETVVSSLLQNFVAGTWIHITTTWNSNGKNIYINGIYQNHDATPLSLTIAPCRMGLDGYAGGSSYFNGLIDEVRIYNRALTAGEIQQLYQIGARTVKFKQ